MRDEAAANADSDKAETERISKMNAADSMIFQTEKQLKEYGEKLSGGNKTAVEGALADLKSAHEAKDLARIDTAMEAINAAWQAASQEMYAAGGAEGGQGQPVPVVSPVPTARPMAATARAIPPVTMLPTWTTKKWTANKSLIFADFRLISLIKCRRTEKGRKRLLLAFLLFITAMVVAAMEIFERGWLEKLTAIVGAFTRYLSGFMSEFRQYQSFHIGRCGPAARLSCFLSMAFYSKRGTTSPFTTPKWPLTNPKTDL